jgi:hypothetical protein
MNLIFTLLILLTFGQVQQTQQASSSVALSEAEAKELADVAQTVKQTADEGNAAIRRAVLSELTATEAIASIGTIKEAFWKLEATRANDQRIRLKIKAVHGCLDCEFTPDLRQLLRPSQPSQEQSKEASKQ